MSRGGYTSAIAIWSLGCIFGELLQRVRRVGSASTPHLHVAPMFAMHGVPITPKSGCALSFSMYTVYYTGESGQLKLAGEQADRGMERMRTKTELFLLLGKVFWHHLAFSSPPFYAVNVLAILTDKSALLCCLRAALRA